MRKTFCDRCGAVIDDGENGEVWQVRAEYHVRDDGEMNGVDLETFELCPECYEAMFEDEK